MVEVIKELPEYITPAQAMRAAGVSSSTFQYWRKTRPLLTRKDPCGRSMVKTKEFLDFCRSRHEARIKGFGKASAKLKKPEEIEMYLRTKIPH